MKRRDLHTWHISHFFSAVLDAVCQIRLTVLLEKKMQTVLKYVGRGALVAWVSLLLVGGVSIVPVGAQALSLSPVLADAKGDACQGIGLAGSGGCGDNGAALTSAISAVVNIFSAIVGVAGVIMVIAAGFRFITSSGDTSKIAGAKSTIIYAIVGLVVAAMAQVIVHFFLGAAKGK